MFGCVVAGRPLQTTMQLIDNAHAVFQLASASSINHICVFLIGDSPLPFGYGASVHLNWPGRGFQFLGALTNEKPSAIFRLRGNYSASTSNPHSAFSSGFSTPDDPMATDVVAILGIAIEPLLTIESHLASLPPAVIRDPTSETTMVAERVVKHLFNYLSSFTSGNAGSFTSDSYVQLGVIQRWYESFLSKLRAGGVGFLERTD